MVAFDVDAMDDVGIDRIEIYDGDELVATVTESPYVTEVLLTSADNGSHTFSAVAYDTAGQTAQSEVVPLSVNIVGGEILALREDIGDVQIALLGLGAPKLALLPDDDLLVTGMARLDAAPEIRTGLLVRGYSEELSLLWSNEHAPPEGGLALEYSGFSTPSVAASSALAYVGGTAELSTGAQELTAFSLDVRTGELAGTNVLWSSDDPVFPLPVSVGPEDDVFATAAIAEAARYSPDFTAERWRAAPLGDGILELASTPDGAVLVLFAGGGCAPDASVCLCKLSSEGEVLWTRAVAESTELGPPTRPSISSDGHSSIAAPLSEGSVLLLAFDDQGNEVSTIVLDDDQAELFPRDVTHTPSGDMVLVGSAVEMDVLSAWAVRLRMDGEILWEQTYAIGGSDAVASGVAVSPNGRLYVTGHADTFDTDFLTYGARAWIAEIAL